MKQEKYRAHRWHARGKCRNDGKVRCPRCQELVPRKHWESHMVKHAPEMFRRPMLPPPTP